MSNVKIKLGHPAYRNRTYIEEVAFEVCSQIPGLFEITEGNREKKQKKKLDELD
jgi:hypothetical protein